MSKKSRKLENKISKLKHEKNILLDKLYDLGLAPFYGYYEKRLEAEEKVKEE